MGLFARRRRLPSVVALVVGHERELRRNQQDQREGWQATSSALWPMPIEALASDE